MIRDGYWILAGVFFTLFSGTGLILIRRDLMPFRWLGPGFFLLILMAVYPMFFTVYSSLTNYRDGHLLTLRQVVQLFESRLYAPDDSPEYSWTAYLKEPQWALILEYDGQQFFADTSGTMEPLEYQVELPDSIRGYEKVAFQQVVGRLPELQSLFFGDSDAPVRLQTSRVATQLEQRYRYDRNVPAMIDQQTGIVYYQNDRTGLFSSAENQHLRPGFQTFTGFSNYRRLFTNRAIRGPFLEIFTWTFVFSLFSTGLTFLLGFSLALNLESMNFPGKKLVRSALILPQAIPGVIGILIWRGLLNPHFGVINEIIRLFSTDVPAWFADPMAARIAVIVINLWLGYPYMLLICSGALQAIPRELYEAAQVDGASGFTRLQNITMPLLLRAVGPVLVATFTMNLNNFNVIYLFNGGGPPIAGATTPAGHTDILISYTYRLAFEGLRGSDYGFAAAITVVIFFMLTVVTMFNLSKTRVWEGEHDN